MRALTVRLVAVGVVLSWAGLASAQTADEVIEKTIAALGGRAAMEKIKTGIMTGTISLQTPVGDIPGTIEIYNAVPNKVRTVIKADQILVLHHGTIRERGTHRELLARGGLYDRLFRLQAGLAAGDRERARAV